MLDEVVEKLDDEFLAVNFVAYAEDRAQAPGELGAFATRGIMDVDFLDPVDRFADAIR